MRSLGAIVIGIGNYDYDPGAFPPLKYAPKDADKVLLYLSTCWPKAGEATVIRIPQEDATADGVASAFDTLTQAGPFDLQVVFLSGHGVVDGDCAGFVLQPAAVTGGLALLDDSMLDRLLASVTAARTVLILDCCYAEGIVRRMRYFSSLGDSDARLFIASSREQQLTWEDEIVGHGIFTAHLLDLLNTGNSTKLEGVRDRLDVDGELFPVLCDQVPLYVLEHKRQRQEPVKGGISIRAVTLPVAGAARRIVERSAFGTALRRLRQILSGIVTASVIFLVAVFSLAYYAEADRYGSIRLHHGTKGLAPIFRFVPTLRIDSGFAASDLSQDPAISYAVLAGETTGFWTQMSRRGYRAWYDAVRPSLDPRAAARYDILLAAGGSRPVYGLDEQSPPSEIAFAAWALLDDSDPKQLDILFSHVLGANRSSPALSPFSPNDVDFSILDRPQTQLASYADALRAAAAVDPDRTFDSYVGFLKATRIWLSHSSREQHGQEAQRRAADDVADVFATITKAKADRGELTPDPMMVSKLTQLGTLGYEDLVHLALGRVVSPSSGNPGAMLALSAFHGNSSDPDEAAALRRLKDALDDSPASQQIVEQAYKRFVEAGGPEQSDLTAFLIAAADKKALPPAVIATVIGKAKEAIDRNGGEFTDYEYARILAHAMSQVPEDSRGTAYRLIDVVAHGVTPISSFVAEIYTALARQRLDTPAMFDHVVAEAIAVPPYRPQGSEVAAEPLPGMAIVVGHGPWLEALAVGGTTRQLSPVAIDVLEEHAVDPAFHDVIVRALSRQPTAVAQRCWTSSCGRLLRNMPADAAKRQLTADVLAEQLASLPRAEFLTALATLRKEREAEIEPEIRIALGSTIINAQLTRVRTVPLGRQLFE